MADAEAGRRFELARPRLRATATRLLGSSADADDVLQDAWLRLDRTDVSAIGNLDAWLTTVVSRLCLDVLGSARRVRERSWQVEPWSDEPADDSAGPADEAESTDLVTGALVLVLETLSPAERLAFVLHDVFGRSFDEVATAVSRSPVAARQLASRARRRIRAAAPAARPTRAMERRVVAAWLRAVEAGDLAALLALLDEGAVLHADYGAASVDLDGARRIAGQALAARRLAANAELVRLGDRPGVIAHDGDAVVSLMAFVIRDDRILALDVLADPRRLPERGH